MLIIIVFIAVFIGIFIKKISYIKKELEEQKKYFIDKTNYFEESIKTNEIYFDNMLKLNRFYSDLILKLNEFSDNSNYLEVFNIISEFYKINNLTNKIEKNNFINQYKGSIGEEIFRKILINHKIKGRHLELLNNFNLNDDKSNNQIDFIVVSPSSSEENALKIYLIEVKNYSEDAIKNIKISNDNLIVNYKGKNDNDGLEVNFSSYTKNETNEFAKINNRKLLLSSIINDFQREQNAKVHFFSIIAFTGDKSLLNLEKSEYNIKNNEYIEILINNSNLKVQVLFGNEDIVSYFEKHISINPKKNSIELCTKLTNSIKNSQKFKESTNIKFIKEDIVDVFDGIYNYFEDNKQEKIIIPKIKKINNK